MNEGRRIIRYPNRSRRQHRTIMMMRLKLGCSILSVCAVAVVVLCSPPEGPIKCSNNDDNTDCTITNSYGAFPDRSVCRVANVVYPTTEAEVVSAVAKATMDGTKVKVATRFSHSIPKLSCPDGAAGVLISTKYLNRTLAIDAKAMTVTVESGVTLRQLIREAAEAGMALPYTPYWWGLTVGGMLGTGAHGSSLFGKGSAVHDYVRQLRIVTPGLPKEGHARVRTLDSSSNPLHLNAARVSLGVLGVITQVRLQLQPMFKRSITYQTKDDSELGDEATRFGQRHEFADITWYPSQRKAVYRVDDRVSSDVPGNATYDSIAFRSTPSVALAAIRTLEETHEATRDAEGKCIDAKSVTRTLSTAAYGLKNSGVLFNGYPVVGHQNQVQASGTCLDSPRDAMVTACPWDPRVKGEFFHQTAVRIGLSKVKAFIGDVQGLVQLEPRSMCGVELYNGILIRYVKASAAYLANHEDALDFDLTYYRSREPRKPRLHEEVLEEVEQMAVFKYAGLPHWGKNRNLAFEGAIAKYENASEFIKVKELFDPRGLFSSEWTDRVLGLKDGVTIPGKGCALEGLCICSQDIHCAPENGYVCVPGRVFKEARVCASSN